MKEKTNKKFMLLSAIGIIMVVDAHSGTSLALFTEYLPYNSFFMPMFVFIAGYFNKIDENSKIWEYFKKKARRLLLPYFLISIVVWGGEVLINCLRFGELLLPTIQEIGMAFLRAVVTGNMVWLADPMWFVPALFLTEIIYAIVKKILMSIKLWNDILVLAILGIANVLAVCMGKNNLATPGNALLLKVCFFIPFLQLGILYRKKGEKLLKCVNPWVLIAVLMLVNMVRMMYLPDPDNISFINLMVLGGFTSPYYWTPLVSSVIGILFWLTIVDMIGPALYEDRLINYISNNTFWIMGWHLAMLNLLNCILMIIHEKLHPIVGFDIDLFRANWWYRWEEYPFFHLAYYMVGVLGSLLTKMLYDSIKKRFVARYSEN